MEYVVSFLPVFMDQAAADPTRSTVVAMENFMMRAEL
jgi:hypothetical protein